MLYAQNKETNRSDRKAGQKAERKTIQKNREQSLRALDGLQAFSSHHNRL